MDIKIALLYICTGRYNQFFKGFYESSMKYLLADKAEKTYFVWTDDDHLADGLPNVRIYHKECAGFPADSLFRFEMFLQAEEELKKFDYVYFFNANAECIKPIGEEILPDESGLAMGIWGGKRLHQPACFYPYERNKKSLAYVAPYGKNYTYFMGGLNGGKSDVYLQMIQTLATNIRDDYSRGIIAQVHDESHINAYMRTHRCKQLSTTLNRPEEWADETTKLIFREKTHIDPYFNKGRKTSRWTHYKKGLIIIKNAIRWYLCI